MLLQYRSSRDVAGHVWACRSILASSTNRESVWLIVQGSKEQLASLHNHVQHKCRLSAESCSSHLATSLGRWRIRVTSALLVFLSNRWQVPIPFWGAAKTLLDDDEIIKFDGDLTEFWQKQVGTFWHTLYSRSLICCVLVTVLTFELFEQLAACFYARKQLLLSARLSQRNSVRLSVRPSHGWISQKRCKLGLPNLHRRLPGRL